MLATSSLLNEPSANPLMSVQSPSHLPNRVCAISPRGNHRRPSTGSLSSDNPAVSHPTPSQAASPTTIPILKSSPVLVSSPVTRRTGARTPRRAVGGSGFTSPLLRRAQSIESGGTLETEEAMNDVVLLPTGVVSSSIVAPSRLNSNISSFSTLKSSGGFSSASTATDIARDHIGMSADSSVPSTPKSLFQERSSAEVSPGKKPMAAGDKKGAKLVPRLLIPPDRSHNANTDSPRSPVSQRDGSASVDGQLPSPRGGKSSVLAKLKNMFGTPRKQRLNSEAGEFVGKSPRGRRLSASSLMSPRNPKSTDQQQSTPRQRGPSPTSPVATRNELVPPNTKQSPTVALPKAFTTSDSSIITPSPTIVSQLRSPKAESQRGAVGFVFDAESHLSKDETQSEDLPEAVGDFLDWTRKEWNPRLKSRSFDGITTAAVLPSVVEDPSNSRRLDRARSISNGEALGHMGADSSPMGADPRKVVFPRSILHDPSHARTRVSIQDGSDRLESSSRTGSNQLKRVRFSNSNLNEVTVFVMEIERVVSTPSDDSESDDSYSSSGEEDEVYDLKQSRRCQDHRSPRWSTTIRSKEDTSDDLNQAVQSMVNKTTTSSFDCSTDYGQDGYSSYGTSVEESVCLDINAFN